jgi:hypothetical protein
MKIIVNYWITNPFGGGLQSGFHNAMVFSPTDERFFEFTREDWEDWVNEQYERGRIKTDESIDSLRFYIYVISGKPRFYKCLFPGYDDNGKVLGVEEHGKIGYRFI